MKKETKEFLKLAKDNLRIAKKNFEIGLYKSSCFWLQQSVELFLKAFLIEKGIFNPKIFEMNGLDKLSSHATLTRYDVGSLENIDEKDTKEEIEIVEKVREFVLRNLQD